VLQTRGGQLANTALAEVTPAEIPFVSLRHCLPTALLAGKASFNDTVAGARAVLASAQLLLDLAGQRIVAGGLEIALSPAELALLVVFARRTMQGQAPLPASGKNAQDAEYAQCYLNEYWRIVGNQAEMEATKHALRNGMDGDYFSQRKSKLERRLRTALGQAAQAYRISDGDQRPPRYGLTLGRDAVRFVKIKN